MVQNGTEMDPLEHPGGLGVPVRVSSGQPFRAMGRFCAYQAQKILSEGFGPTRPLKATSSEGMGLTRHIPTTPSDDFGFSRFLQTPCKGFGPTKHLQTTPSEDFGPSRLLQITHPRTWGRRSISQQPLPMALVQSSLFKQPLSMAPENTHRPL